MPTYAQGQIVVEDQVGVYHCIARCLRRAFLCGVDTYTGQDLSHRKDWILDRMRKLARLFAIEVCCYSVMRNYLHVVLRNRPGIAEQWSDDEIDLRWRRVFRPRPGVALTESFNFSRQAITNTRRSSRRARSRSATRLREPMSRQIAPNDNLMGV
jgi:hypothetical protein